MVWMDQGKEGDGFLGYKQFISHMVSGPSSGEVFAEACGATLFHSFPGSKQW